MEKQKIELNVTEYVERIMKVNKLASDYEYETLYEDESEALNELISFIDKKIGQWEWELKYDISKRGQPQLDEDLAEELEKELPEVTFS